MSSRAHDNAPACTFVVGSPRSGTYLLSLMIAAEFGIAMPVETHFVPLFARWLPLFGDLAEDDNRARLLACIYDFLEIWTPRSERDRDAHVIREHSLLATRGDAAAIVAASDSYPTLVDGLFSAFARHHGCAGYGDKSAFFRHIDLDDIAAGVSRARFIHIVRDGRDVVLSWLGIWTGPVNLTQGALTWAEHVARKRDWGQRNPDRYLEVRYEDLLTQREQVMDAIATFLGDEVQRADGSFHTSSLAGALAGGEPHAKLSQPLDPSNSGKWRERMDTRDLALFESLAGNTLAAAGYPREGLPQLAPGRLSQTLARLRARLGLHELQIQSKSLLPLVILLCRHTRLPLVRLLNRRYPEFRRDRVAR